MYDMQSQRFGKPGNITDTVNIYGSTRALILLGPVDSSVCRTVHNVGETAFRYVALYSAGIGYIQFLMPHICGDSGHSRLQYVREFLS